MIVNMGWLTRMAAVFTLVVAGGHSVVSEWLDSGHSAGAFTLARLRWGSDLPRSSFGFRSAWNHDYPRAERHLSLIIRELTLRGFAPTAMSCLRSTIRISSRTPSS